MNLFAEVGEDGQADDGEKSHAGGTLPARWVQNCRGMNKMYIITGYKRSVAGCGSHRSHVR